MVDIMALPHLSKLLVRRRMPGREGGGVAILIALTLAVLIGFAGIVLDLGRLFVNKTELQNAADACALAAAGQLVCDPAGGLCEVGFLHDAEAAGIFVAARNTSDFQDAAVTIAPDDVKFHTEVGPIEDFKTRLSAHPNSKFVMCTARSAAIPPRFMQVLRAYLSVVSEPRVIQASAVATLAPGQSACNAAPIGICTKTGAAAPNFGYETTAGADDGTVKVGQWITESFNRGTGADDDAELAGTTFRWVDFTPSAGGASEIRDQLLGKGSVCNIRVDESDVREQGVKQGAKSAWNTRFGIYPNGANAPTPADVAPDKTGYAYPSATIGFNQSAYTDYRARQAAHTPFSKQDYAEKGPNGNVNGNPLSQSEHLEYGAERRLVPVPLIECGKAPAPTRIRGMGCVLMLNPMSNGSIGTIYLEWRGMANSPSSPCRSTGLAGGTNGPLVPTLVQ